MWYKRPPGTLHQSRSSGTKRVGSRQHHRSLRRSQQRTRTGGSSVALSKPHDKLDPYREEWRTASIKEYQGQKTVYPDFARKQPTTTSESFLSIVQQRFQSDATVARARFGDHEASQPVDSTVIKFEWVRWPGAIGVGLPKTAPVTEGKRTSVALARDLVVQRVLNIEADDVLETVYPLLYVYWPVESIERVDLPYPVSLCIAIYIARRVTVIKGCEMLDKSWHPVDKNYIRSYRGYLEHLRTHEKLSLCLVKKLVHGQVITLSACTEDGPEEAVYRFNRIETLPSGSSVIRGAVLSPKDSGLLVQELPAEENEEIRFLLSNDISSLFVPTAQL